MRARITLLILLSIASANTTLAEGLRRDSDSAAAGIHLTIRSQVRATVHNDTLCIERWGSEDYQLGLGPQSLEPLPRAEAGANSPCQQATATAYVMPANSNARLLTLIASVE